MISREEKLEVLRVIAHPVRIQILEELRKGLKCVSDLEGFSEIRLSSISQHLSLLRNHDFIDFYIDGRPPCYFLKEPFIQDLLEVLGKKYEYDLPAPACCPVTRKGKYPGERKN